jgi:hypothetical protein
MSSYDSLNNNLKEIVFDYANILEDFLMSSRNEGSKKIYEYCGEISCITNNEWNFINKYYEEYKSIIKLSRYTRNIDGHIFDYAIRYLRYPLIQLMLKIHPSLYCYILRYSRAIRELIMLRGEQADFWINTLVEVCLVSGYSPKRIIYDIWFQDPLWAKCHPGSCKPTLRKLRGRLENKRRYLLKQQT